VAALPDSAREVIESGALAHLVTLNEDGSPQITCVWAGLDGDEIVCGHVPHLRKLENLERDPRVALSMEAEGTGARGLKRHLVVYGTAKITKGGAPELLQRLADRYLGPGAEFSPKPDPPPGYVTHISVDRVAGEGPWASQV
jgi:PPOX class probable F420-dependent enzyme